MFKKWTVFASIGVSSIIKSAFLFASAFVLYTFGIIPALFLTAMGVLQLATAVVGGVAAVGVIHTRAFIRKPAHQA